MFERIKNYGNLSESVETKIIQAINAGELKPGDKLPSERDLGELFSVSRTVIRDALKTLAGLGVVRIRQGTGAFVNSVEQDGGSGRLASLLQISQGTAEELFQVRRILEGQSVFWCTQKATARDLWELEKMVDKAKDLEDQTRLDLLDAEFHLKISETAGNRVLLRLMSNLLDLSAANRVRVPVPPGRQRLSVLDHERIVEAIRLRNPELARQYMLKHLLDVKEAAGISNFNGQA